MNNCLQFSNKDYLKSTNQYLQSWLQIDNTLYSLCQKNHDHDSMNSINAKLWIIGRTYMTGIERKIESNGKQGGSLSQLAEHLYKNRHKVNKIFSQLKFSCRGSKLTLNKLESIVTLHGELVELIKQVTRRNQSSRSFASKYMHFHCPIVPIYDSYASQALTKFIRWNNQLIIFNKPKIVDEDYLWFVLRFWELYKRASEVIDVEKVKYLDYYLLCVAEELNKKKI